LGLALLKPAELRGKFLDLEFNLLVVLRNHIGLRGLLITQVFLGIRLGFGNCLVFLFEGVFVLDDFGIDKTFEPSVHFDRIPVHLRGTAERFDFGDVFVGKTVGLQPGVNRFRVVRNRLVKGLELRVRLNIKLAAKRPQFLQLAFEFDGDSVAELSGEFVALLLQRVALLLRSRYSLTRECLELVERFVRLRLAIWRKRNRVEIIGRFWLGILRLGGIIPRLRRIVLRLGGVILRLRSIVLRLRRVVLRLWGIILWLGGVVFRLRRAGLLSGFGRKHLIQL